LCYVIENFSLNFFKLTWNSKTNSLFYYRTGGVTVSLLQTYISNPLFLQNGLTKAYLISCTRFFFLNRLFSLTTNSLFYPKQLLALNFTKSVQYWTLLTTLDNLKRLKKNEKFTHRSLATVTPIYYQLIQTSNIFLQNCAFKTSLFGFVQLVLTNWQSWNTRTSSLTPYLIINTKHRFLRFFNFYFFRN
jgi:hypothetical protein